MPTSHLNIGFNQGPKTLIASPIKYGILKPQVALTRSVPSSAPTLLAYISSLGQIAAGVILGQSCYLQSPVVGDFDTTGGATLATCNVFAPGPNTGKMVGLFNPVVTPRDITGIPLGGQFFSDGTSLYAAPNDMVTVCNTLIARGVIQQFVWQPANPNTANGFRGAFDPQMLVVGSAVYNNWLSYLDSWATFIKKLVLPGGAPAPCIFAPFAEMNQATGFWFATIGGTISLAQFSAMWQLTYNYLMVTKGLGPSGTNQLLWMWEVQGYNSPTTLNGYPGNSYNDLVSIDQFSQNGNVITVDTATLNALASTGLPVSIGSTGWQDPSAGYAVNAAPFTQNTYTQLVQPFLNLSPVPIWSIVTWDASSVPNGTSVNSQNGALLSLTAGPMLDLSRVPAGISQAK